MRTKICGYCHVEFPLTHEHWYTKVTKAGVGYLKKDSISFRSVCKKCNGKQRTDKIRARRMKELEVNTLEEYKSAYIDQMSLSSRKYDYGDVKRVTPAQAAKAKRQALAPDYIAQTMRTVVDNLTLEQIEERRNQIKRYRQWLNDRDQGNNRICLGCKESKDRKENFGYRKQSNTYESYCTGCCTEKMRKLRADSPELRAYLKDYGLKRSAEITDSYVKTLIRETIGIPTNNITPEIIELKRESVKLYREFKQLKQQLYGTTETTK